MWPLLPPSSRHAAIETGCDSHFEIPIHVGHVRSESQSVQYVSLDIWTSCKAYKHYKIKVHSLNYGIRVREKINCNIIDMYL